MKVGELFRRNVFTTPGCEWRGEVERKHLYIFLGDSMMWKKGIFLREDGVVEKFYLDEMCGVNETG